MAEKFPCFKGASSLVVFDSKAVRAKPNTESSVMCVTGMSEQMRVAMSESSKDMALMSCLDALTNGIDKQAVLSMRPGDEKAPSLTVMLCKDTHERSVGKDNKASTMMTVMIRADLDLSESFTSGRQHEDGFMDHENQEAVLPVAEGVPMSATLIAQLKAEQALSATSNAKQAKLYRGVVTLRPGTVFTVSIMGKDLTAVTTRNVTKPAPPGSMLKLRGLTFTLSGGRLMANADKCEVVDHSNAAATLALALSKNTYNFINHDIMVGTMPLPAGMRSGFALPVTFADDAHTALMFNPTPEHHNFALAPGTKVPSYALYGAVLHVVPLSEQIEMSRKSKCPVVTLTCPPIVDMNKESEWKYKKKDNNNDYAHGYATLFSSAAIETPNGTSVTYSSFTMRLMPDMLMELSMLPPGALMLKFARQFVSGFIGHVLIQNDGEPHCEMLRGIPMMVGHGYANQVVAKTSDIVRAIGFRVPATLALRYMLANLVARYSEFGRGEQSDDGGVSVFDESEASAAEAAFRGDIEAMWNASRAKFNPKRNVIPLDIYPDVALANHALSAAIFEATASGKAFDLKAAEESVALSPHREKLMADYVFFVVPDAFKPNAMRRADLDNEEAVHAEYFFRGGKIHKDASREFTQWAGKLKVVPDFLVYAVRANSFETDGNFFSADSVGKLYDLGMAAFSESAAREDSPDVSLSAKHVREDAAKAAAADNEREITKISGDGELSINTSDGSAKLKRMTPLDVDADEVPEGRRHRKRAGDK